MEELRLYIPLRTLYKKMVNGEVESNGERLALEVDKALREEGLGENGYFLHYREFAQAMIQFFFESRTGFTPEQPQALRVTFNTEEIIVTPDDILVADDGTVRIRRVMTGHSRSEDGESIGAAAFLAAAAQAFPQAVAELVYLADRQAQPISLTARKIENRCDTIKSHLAAIRNGQFPAKASSFSCPNCPALFVCGPVPIGRLKPEIRPATVDVKKS